MSFQIHKTSVHQRNSNEDIFDGIWALRPYIDSEGPYTIKVQKSTKIIDKVVHVTSVCQLILQSHENTFCAKKTKTKIIFRIFVSTVSLVIFVFFVQINDRIFIFGWTIPLNKYRSE